MQEEPIFCVNPEQLAKIDSGINLIFDVLCEMEPDIDTDPDGDWEENMKKLQKYIDSVEYSHKLILDRIKRKLYIGEIVFARAERAEAVNV